MQFRNIQKHKYQSKIFSQIVISGDFGVKNSDKLHSSELCCYIVDIQCYKPRYFNLFYLTTKKPKKRLSK